MYLMKQESKILKKSLPKAEKKISTEIMRKNAELVSKLKSIGYPSLASILSYDSLKK